MSRKIPALIPHFRPVSQKAYDTFVRRIFAIVPKDNRCADMIDALDMYLDGNRETYAAHLDEHTAITFEMLRFDIDQAIERSARARSPRRRKAVETPGTEVLPKTADDKKSAKKSTEESAKRSEKKPEKALDVNPELFQGIHPELFQKMTQELFQEITHEMTQGHAPDKDKKPEEDYAAQPRWMRRAAIMSMRPKRKWKKIG